VVYREAPDRGHYASDDIMGEARRAARTDGVVIVGAGQAGGRAAESLRNSGFTGSVILVGDETERPYERPSLSKEMLLDTSRETVSWLHAPAFYADQEIDLRCGVSAMAIDRSTRRVHLSNGDSIPFGVTILATGARPRPLVLRGHAEQSTFMLRTLADARKLRAELSEGRNVVIVGAGFIGLEVAAAASQRGCRVTVVEAAPAPLGRVVPPEIGLFYEQLHRRHGVSFRFNTQVTGVTQRGAQHVVETNTGQEIPCDMLLVGIGIIPNDSLAADAGLEADRGIVVDQYGATRDPLIFAVGDVARQFNPRLGRHILLESWQNAQNQAMAVARNLGAESAPIPYDAIPWFWSDQYGLNLQMYGIAEAGGEITMRGRFEDKSWIMFQTFEGRIVGMIGLNAARDMRGLRDFIGREASKSELANTDVALSELVRRAKPQAASLL